MASSAHLTIARFVDRGILEEGRVRALVECVEGVNEALEQEFGGGGGYGEEWGWTVGEEKGLVCREGRVWYGGGESLGEGEGF